MASKIHLQHVLIPRFRKISTTLCETPLVQNGGISVWSLLVGDKGFRGILITKDNRTYITQRNLQLVAHDP